MLYNLSFLAAILALARNAAADPSSTTTNPATPTAAPLLDLPPFSGTFSIAYPPSDKIPPTDTPQVQKWLAELDLTDVPDWPLVPFTEDGDPKNPKVIPEEACDWTETGCFNKDVTTCPLGVWGLTYDDGPTEFSPQLYDFLDKTEQKATLFYIGSNVVENWQAARRACGAGHHIAVHTWSHPPSTSLTNEQFIAEVKYTEMAIKEVCGFTTTYFRPPYGDIDNRIRSLLWKMGYTSVIWDYDTDDWMMAPGGQRTEAQVDQAFDQWIAAAPQDKAGHIILEHELYQNTVNAAIKNLPRVQATWKTMSVSACTNNSHPYQEKNITLATMDGAKTGIDLDNGNSSTPTTGAGGSQPTSSGQDQGKNSDEVKSAAFLSVGLLSKEVAALVVMSATIAIAVI
ncbi:chitin deacetylase [Mortierella polycephala]|uniref:Chitin deacetylase n=1 Tax=Mortierella polycephala TaxID=41804 RepID=A0A9P6U599_9FUNG|nr:chitin deacetylase [Mortierella polycephala]